MSARERPEVRVRDNGRGEAKTAVADLEATLGSTPPLLGDGTTAPDRRDVSVRYLLGTFLTGAIALGLMGGALWGAAEGRGHLTTAANAAVLHAEETGPVTKVSRLVRPVPTAAPTDRRVFSVPMRVPTATGDEIRPRPFAHLKLALDAGHVSSRETPRFDPLSVFKPQVETTTTALAAGAIYGASVETDVRLRQTALDPTADMLATNDDVTPGQIAQRIEFALSPEGPLTASIAFEPVAIPSPSAAASARALAARSNVRVIEENVTVAGAGAAMAEETSEKVLLVSRNGVSASLTALAPERGDQFANALDALAKMAGDGGETGERQALRVAFARDADGKERLVRAGLYDGDRFRAAVAMDDEGQIAPASKPSGGAIMPVAPKAPAPRKVLDRSLHEALHQTAYAYGINDDSTARVAELIASGTDFKARVRDGDAVEVLMALPEGKAELTAEAEMVFVRARIGERTVSHYRHVDRDGKIGWFDAEGRGARPFLIRKPITGGKFRSPYGMRRHPIRRRMRMHWGVDWSAPSGTPILAAADGTVKEARWAGGYGRRIILSHANGYETSYSHQRAFAKGMRSGARVRQGQVIGYVGTTGLSTGNHLHYELSINGDRVDPMRVRLPAAERLKGVELQRFHDARQRIDGLLEAQSDPKSVAAR